MPVGCVAKQAIAYLNCRKRVMVFIGLVIDELNLQKNFNIIDIGGGDSRLVDHLLQRGFSNITVLDISTEALEKAKIRLQNSLENVEFLASDVTLFWPN